MANRKKSHDLEPIDVYGNWRVKTLISPILKVGLIPRKSTFRITNDKEGHVLEKKSNVRWNGKSKIPLQPVGVGTPEYQAGFRLKADVKSFGQRFDVFFGSRNDGESLIFYISDDAYKPHAGSFGTAGRGG